MKAELRAHVLSEAEHAAWDRVVAQSPDGSAYSRSDYLRVLCEATGGSFRIVAVSRGEEIQGGVALYEEPSWLGRIVAPRLLLYYNGPVLRHHETRYPSEQASRRLAVLSALAAALPRDGYARFSLKSRPTLHDARVFLRDGWTVRPAYTYEVSLEDMGGLWKKVDHNLRRLVERCDREGIRVGADGDFESFYSLHRGTHERKGVDLYLSEERFRRYVERLTAAGLCRLYHARLPDGRSVSSQLVLLGHPVTHTVTAGADPQHLKLGATALLRWKVFEDLASLGYRANDLTDAALNPVTKFKSQLGGDLRVSLVLSRPEGFAFRAHRFVSGLPERALRRAARFRRSQGDG